MICAEKIIVSAAIAFMAGGFVMIGKNNMGNRIREINQRVTTAERVQVMLGICYPEGVYKASAAPICPAFKKYIHKKADKAEAEFQEEVGK